MSSRWFLSWMKVALFTLTGGAIASAYLARTDRVEAQKDRPIFPDVKPNYWAYPFIDTLAERGLVKGYLDGTFRPEKPVDRDEFAAMIRQAFEQQKVREIPSGSTFKDVPEGYWAAPPIQEAYETGFMKGTSEDLFRPNRGLTRTQAVVALTKGLNLNYDRPTGNRDRGQANSDPATLANQPPKVQKRLLFPLASTVLMQPLLPILSKQSQTPAKQSSPTAVQPANTPTQASALELLKSYYKDADRIPKSSVNPVATATQAKIVVNYPEPSLFNPDKLLTRSAATALIYQALVYRGQLEPLPSQVEASRYIPTPVEGSDRASQ